MSTGRARVLRLCGAALLLLGGAIHLWLNLDDYGTEDIGRAFAANAGVSALVAAYLVLRDDWIGPVAGIAVSAGSLGAFVLSRQSEGVLGFSESSYTNPSPEALLTVLAEVLAIVVLGLAVVEERRATSSPRS